MLSFSFSNTFKGVVFKSLFTVSFVCFLRDYFWGFVLFIWMGHISLCLCLHYNLSLKIWRLRKQQLLPVLAVWCGRALLVSRLLSLKISLMYRYNFFRGVLWYMSCLGPCRCASFSNFPQLLLNYLISWRVSPSIFLRVLHNLLYSYAHNLLSPGICWVLSPLIFMNCTTYHAFMASSLRS